MKKISLLSLFIFNFSLFTCVAQDRHRIDSLQNEIKKFDAHKEELGNKATASMDSIKANLLFSICSTFNNKNYDSAITYAKKCLVLSKKIEYKNGIDNGYNGCNYYGDQGNYKDALNINKDALSYYKKIGDEKGIASSYNRLGSNNFELGNYFEALTNFFDALSVYNKIQDKRGITYSYNHLGLLYDFTGKFPEALKNYWSAMEIEQKIGDTNGMATSYTYIGITYFHQKKYSEGLSNEFKALKFSEDIKDMNRVAWANNFLGEIYFAQSNYSEALKYFSNSLKIVEQLKQLDDVAYASIHIGEIYEKQGDFQQALKFEVRGLSLARQTGSKDFTTKAYHDLAEINANLGNYNTAYGQEIMYKQYYDSVNNKENERKFTGLQMQNDFNRKQDSIGAEQDKKDAVAAAIETKENQRHRIIRNSLAGGFSLMFIASGIFFFQRRKISKEKKRSDELLLNILPAEVAEELKDKGSADAKAFDDVTVIFTDFKGFTTISEKLSAKELVAEIDYCFKGFDAIMEKYGIEKIKTIGDSYMAAGGLPVANKTHAKDVVNAALEIVKFMETHKQLRTKENKPVFEIRIGINTGPVVAGIVGVKKFAYDIWGDTVNLASRMESSGEPGKVNISGSTYKLVKNDFNCTYRGKIQAKNKGEVDMYFVG